MPQYTKFQTDVMSNSYQKYCNIQVCCTFTCLCTNTEMKLCKNRQHTSSVAHFILTGTLSTLIGSLPAQSLLPILL